MPSIGISQVLASFKINYIGIRSVSKKWYRYITNGNHFIHLKKINAPLLAPIIDKEHHGGAQNGKIKIFDSFYGLYVFF